MVRYWLAFLLLTASFAAYAQTDSSGQEGKPAGKKVFSISVDLVQIDVTATDSDGRHVTDLTPEDFIITQDYKPQEITSFSLVRVKDPVEVRSPVYQPAAPDEAAASVPAPATMEYRPDQLRRVVALVVDDLGISFPGMYYVRNSIRKWVENEMQPGDLAALVLTSKGVGTLQQFTGSREMILNATENLYYNLSGRVGPDICQDNTAQLEVSLPGDLSQIPSGGEHRRQLTLASLGSVQYVLEGLMNLPGRKSMILFSEDLWMNFDQVVDLEVQDKLQALIKDANRSAVVIHVIDSRGVVGDLQCSQDDLIYAQAGMVTLTNGTGGRFEQGRNDIDGALEDTVRDGDSYYLIGYQPNEELIEEMRSGKPKYHSINVKVKRPGVHVRTRSDFLGTPNLPPEPKTHSERVEHALYTPFATGDLPVRLTALFSQTRSGASRINALVHFDADKLSFGEDEEGWRKTNVELVAALFDVDGQQLDFAARNLTLTAKGESYQEMMQNGVVVSMHVDVEKSGMYQLRVVLTDIETGRMGTASHYVEIPDVRKGRLALSGIALAANRTSPDNDGNNIDGQVIGRDVKGTPAVRIFQPGQTITWAYQVLNAETGTDNKTELETQTRLFHQGTAIYISDTAEISLKPDGASNRMIGIGRMQLKKIVPGEYALQVIVKDKGEENRPRMATQSIDFSIQDPDSSKKSRSTQDK
jgi:VWFA-related protein